MDVIWKTQVKIPYDNQHSRFQPMISLLMKCWLSDEIGTENWFYDVSMHRIFLKNEEDKVKFILRWM